ncbi:MAG TPA: ParB/RepB/Spo0J family partition protein [Acidobacteriaceae bacterium]|nr:ParB/RepB/Spo0J family partition protein [Acidobacteriaceae bacterium]
MRQLKKKARKDLRPDPDNPRKSNSEAEILALTESLKQHGQQVPLIVFDNQILDGHRRYLAAGIANIEFLDVIELDARPTETELRLLQLSIDVHRTSLTPMERSDALARIMRENNWSISELALKLNMKQPLVSKLLKFQDGCEELRAALRDGRADQDKAYTICQEPDHDKQRELLKQAGDLSREQLRQKARSKGEPVALKTAVARFALPKGVMVTVQGPKMDLSGAIEAMLQTLRVLKKGQADSWDIVTAARIMKQRAKSTT